MDRRESLKAIALSTLSASLLTDACKPSANKPAAEPAKGSLTIDRMEEEKKAHEVLTSTTFFTADEMAAIAVLCDIIIPADEISGSATQAKVPEFIEFIVKDMPQHQVPLRGGLRWLNLQSARLYGKAFTDVDSKNRLAMIDEIAYPKKAKPEMMQGVAFFNLMRNLTASGFYTSEIGIKDLGYMGNVPNQWNGVPDDVLKQYGLAYSEKELKECISYAPAV